MEEQKKITDAEYIAEWRSMLDMFHNIPKTDKEQYLGLIDAAKTTKALTPRQKEGIIDRCLYRIELIDNPTQVPFANSERKEERNTYQLSNTESNGKS